MGCFLAALAAVLALAVPASIAHTSLVGAYVVLAAFAVLGTAVLVWRGRQGKAIGSALTTLAVLIVAYAVVVTIIHATR